MLEIGIFEECYSVSFFQNLELTRYFSRGSLVYLPVEPLPLFILVGFVTFTKREQYSTVWHARNNWVRSIGSPSSRRQIPMDDTELGTT